MTEVTYVSPDYFPYTVIGLKDQMFDYRRHFCDEDIFYGKY